MTGGVRKGFQFWLCLQSAPYFTLLWVFLFNGIADVEGTFGLDEAYVGTLLESDAVHYMFDLLSTSSSLICSWSRPTTLLVHNHRHCVQKIGLAVRSEWIEFLQVAEEFRVMSLKSISALMSMTAHCLFRQKIFCDTNSSKRSIKAGTFSTFMEDRRRRYDLRSFPEGRGSIQWRFVDIESGDGTGRSGCHVIRTCQYYCRPVARFPVSREATMPMTPLCQSSLWPQYDGTSVGKSVQVSATILLFSVMVLSKSLRVSLCWLICPAFSRAREIFFSKQVNSFFSRSGYVRRR